jgi:hypothetical protein
MKTQTKREICPSSIETPVAKPIIRPTPCSSPGEAEFTFSSPSGSGCGDDFIKQGLGNERVTAVTTRCLAGQNIFVACAAERKRRSKCSPPPPPPPPPHSNTASSWRGCGLSLSLFKVFLSASGCVSRYRCSLLCAGSARLLRPPDQARLQSSSLHSLCSNPLSRSCPPNGSKV